MNDTLYKTLGVSKSATQSEIKKAFRKHMKSLHPDLNPGDAAKEAKFKKVSAANDILSDENKRALYDRGEIDENGADVAQNPFGGGHRGQPRGAQGQGYGDMGDMFSQMFGGGGQQRGGFQQAFKGQDQRYNMLVSFTEAALGGKKQIYLADGNPINVTIPKGIEAGKTIRLKGKGHAGQNGGPAGDAMIEVKVASHPVFARDGLNIEINLPITIYEAALGGKVEVPTLHGAVGLKIPAGASSGKVFRLKGRGIEMGGKKGDQLVKLQIQMPETVDPKLEAFMKEMEAASPYDPRQKLKASAHV
ncbi:MAG TPA: J domain-containing protein [Rhodobacteraceae bacterium]|nr:J domain-containing protein [Paracoccaceae bacterium]